MNKSKNEQVESQVKAMMIVFFDIKGVIMIEWIPEDQVVNYYLVKYYLEVLPKLRDRVRKKGPKLWEENNGFCFNTMHHITAPPM
jgi:hypothetical protein